MTVHRLIPRKKKKPSIDVTFLLDLEDDISEVLKLETGRRLNSEKDRAALNSEMILMLCREYNMARKTPRL